MSIRVRIYLLTLIAVVALPVSMANASQAETRIYSEVLRAYQSHGMIPPCAFSSQQLERTLKNVDTYNAQYDADFPIAIQNALTARGSGTCSTSPSTAAGAAPAPPSGGGAPPAGGSARSAGGGAPVPLVPVTLATNAALPAPMVLLAVFAAALALLGGSLALARARGWNPGWVLQWGHAWSEAGYRLGGAWGELRDRLPRRR
ncbi:MAG: hypothetical protein ACR2OB_13775 [Solirubrobacteraceae bacterium]